MDVILPAIIFKHLGNSIEFRWINSGFLNKIKIISCVLFSIFKFPLRICHCTYEVHPNRCTLYLGFFHPGTSLALGFVITEVNISIDKALNFELDLLELNNLTVFFSVTEQ